MLLSKGWRCAPAARRRPNARGTIGARAVAISRMLVAGRAGLGALAMLGCLVQMPLAARGAEEIERATHSRTARKEALTALPFDQLDSVEQDKVNAVISQATLYRRLPTQMLNCDPDLYLFVANHPELLANVWQLLGIDDVTLIPTGPETFRAQDGGSTSGTVEFLYRSPEMHLVYAEGTYDGPIFARPVSGACVLLLRTECGTSELGITRVTSRLDAFIRLDHAGAEILVKTFQPLVARVADLSFVQTAGFVESLGQAAEHTPQGMHRLGARLTLIEPSVRRQFVLLTADVAARAQARQAQLIENLPLAERPLTSRAQNR